MPARVALILPSLATLFAWSLAFAVAREQRPPMVAPIVAAASAEPRPTEGDEPLVLPVAIAFATATPARSPTPAVQMRPAPVARVVAAASARERAAIAAIIEDAAREFGQDPGFMVKVAHCESTLDPRAIGRAGEIGVFQFMPRTWAKNGARLGYSPGDIWDVRAQARVTAEMFRRAQQWQWTCARLVR